MTAQPIFFVKGCSPQNSVAAARKVGCAPSKIEAMSVAGFLNSRANTVRISQIFGTQGPVVMSFIFIHADISVAAADEISVTGIPI